MFYEATLIRKKTTSPNGAAPVKPLLDGYRTGDRFRSQRSVHDQKIGISVSNHENEVVFPPNLILPRSTHRPNP